MTATIAATNENPPAFEPTSSLELQSVSDSKILGVSLYSSRAEVTRLYKFAVKTGLNQVNISGLPNVLESESLRVEGRGAATIHDVSVSFAKGEHVPTTSSELAALFKRREQAQNALSRVDKSLASLEGYLSSLTVQHLDYSKLESVMESYNAAGEKLDAKKAALTEELKGLQADIEKEQTRIAVPHENDKLRVKAAIGVFAEQEGDVEIALIYAVPRATWRAFYDIRVDMNAKDDPIKLIYKAAITQSTGEAWDDVPLTLETSTPTFGLGVPRLQPWTLDVYRPPNHFRKSSAIGSASTVPRLPAPMMMRRAKEVTAEADEQATLLDTLEPMAVLGAAVTSKGNVSATFRVPGRVSIPSDNEAHNFTIVELSLQAAMSWVCVPRVDTKAHINARITNASEYTLLAGTASVYVDGSFISRSEVPAVSPKESFDCPLGVDPSIRITYHPVIKKTTHSGGFPFSTKSATHTFSQRITVFNTKSLPVSRVKLIDHIPASQHADIEVKLLSPALTMPAEANNAGGSMKAAPKAGPAVPQKVTVAKDIIAQWDGVDEPDCVVESLGLDRKINWICGVAPQTKVNVSLDWEVTVSPAGLQVVGL
ncbi:hypothetical protein MKEN_00404700 [Mycena kentingensis (nom. inval.)]|nr:hypothetical protein MKEN_00404700 [Mycena kentingensis (nom. inval.)]